MESVEFSFTPRKVAAVLIVSVLFFTLLGAFVQISKFVFGHPYLFGLTDLFNLHFDTSVPTWYASVTLLLCAVLLWIIARAKQQSQDRFSRQWKILSYIFLFMSVDEVATVHEVLGETLKQRLTGETGGFLHYSWVILGGIFVLVFAAAYIRFLLHLPAKTKRLFIVAGFVYVGGALGMEMINARYDALHGQNFTYEMMTVFEEFMEMTGIAVFIYALMTYMTRPNEPVTVCINAAADNLSKVV